MNFLYAHTLNWEVGDTTYPPETYGSTLRALRRFLIKSGFPKEKHTLRPPRNAINAIASQLGRARADRATIGRRAPRSQMTAAYGRSKCVADLRLRNGDVQRIGNGRIPSCGVELPSQHSNPKGATESDAEETNPPGQRPSDNEDEMKSRRNILNMGEDDKSKSDYAESD